MSLLEAGCASFSCDSSNSNGMAELSESATPFSLSVFSSASSSSGKPQNPGIKTKHNHNFSNISY
jgi:hypothetical protein